MKKEAERKNVWKRENSPQENKKAKIMEATFLKEEN
jgi:hypothetical protein